MKQLPAYFERLDDLNSKDIVDMLRREYDYFNNGQGGDYELLDIAADEIERLRNMINEDKNA